MRPGRKSPLRDPQVEEAFAQACANVPTVSSGTEDVDYETEQARPKNEHRTEADAPNKSSDDLQREVRHILAGLNRRPDAFAPLPEHLIEHYSGLIAEARAREAAEAASRDHEDLDVPRWDELGPSPS